MTFRPTGDKMKFKKMQRLGNFNKGIKVIEYAAKVVKDSYIMIPKTSSRISQKQLGMLRLNLTRGVKRECRYGVLGFGHIPLSKKPSGIRMGKGKGPSDTWIDRKRGGMPLARVIFFSNDGKEKAEDTLKTIQKKLPVATTLRLL